MKIPKDFIFLALVLLSLWTLSPLIVIASIAAIAILFFQRLNKYELGTSLLLFGVTVFGYVGLKIGLPVIGKLAGLLGLYLIRDSISAIGRHVTLYTTLAVSFFICLVFYFLGPQTSVAFEKLVDVIYYSVIYVFIFNAIFFFGEKINYIVFSRLAICFILLYIAVAAQYDLAEFKQYISDLSGLRTAVDQWNIENIVYTKDGFGDTTSAVSYQLVGNFIALSLVLLLSYILSSSTPAKILSDCKFLILSHLVFIMMSGARQSILLVMLAAVSLFFCGKNINRRYLARFSLLMCLFVLSLVIVGLALEVRSIVNLFEAEGGFAAVINRQINIDAAYELIAEKPWFGFGFGGYYIPEFGFKSGEFKYFPHNVLLELLSELGVIGTILFLSVWLVHYVNRYHASRISLFKAELYRGVYALPLFTFYFVSALMNEILVKSIALFILTSFMLYRPKSNV